MAVPDGKPATDFSAMDREWVRGIASEAGCGIPAPENPNDGDVLTYDSTSNSWIAAAPGGGGSSDFSETEVTLVVTEDGNYTNVKAYMYGGTDDETGQINAYIIDNDVPTSIDFVYNDGILYDEGTNTITLYLSDGASVNVYFTQGTVTDTTGNITYDSQEDAYVITGDCTIAITAASA